MKYQISYPNDHGSEGDYQAFQQYFGEAELPENLLAEYIRGEFPDAEFVRATDFGAVWEFPDGILNADELPGWIYIHEERGNEMKYDYVTDAEQGTIEAGSVQEAYAILRASITDEMIADGATLWVKPADPASDEARITLGVDAD